MREGDGLNMPLPEHAQRPLEPLDVMRVWQKPEEPLVVLRGWHIPANHFLCCDCGKYRRSH